MSDLEQRVTELERIVRAGYNVRPNKIVACLVYEDTVQTLQNDTLTPITFGLEYYDDYKLHDAVSTPSRIYFPTGGWYYIGSQISFAVNGTNGRAITFRIDGSTYIASHSQQAEPTKVNSVDLSKIYYATQGEYVEVLGRQNCGTTLDTYVNLPQAPVFGIWRLTA